MKFSKQLFYSLNILHSLIAEECFDKEQVSSQKNESCPTCTWSKLLLMPETARRALRMTVPIPAKWSFCHRFPHLLFLFISRRSYVLFLLVETDTLLFSLTSKPSARRSFSFPAKKARWTVDALEGAPCSISLVHHQVARRSWLRFQESHLELLSTFCGNLQYSASLFFLHQFSPPYPLVKKNNPSSQSLSFEIE